MPVATAPGGSAGKPSSGSGATSRASGIEERACAQTRTHCVTHERRIAAEAAVMAWATGAVQHKVPVRKADRPVHCIGWFII
jgi:hypothetical protein